MHYAHTDRAHWVTASASGQRGYCPDCRGDVTARVGQVNKPHWAHVRIDCGYDGPKAGMTSWHQAYQAVVPPDRCEVVIGAHRADIIRPDRHVIEIQHSRPSPPPKRKTKSAARLRYEAERRRSRTAPARAEAREAMRTRETAYKDMTWIIDSRQDRRYSRLHITSERDLDGSSRVLVHGWATNAFDWLVAMRSQVILDLGAGLSVICRGVWSRRDLKRTRGIVVPTVRVLEWINGAPKPVAGLAWVPGLIDDLRPRKRALESYMASLGHEDAASIAGPLLWNGGELR